MARPNIAFVGDEYLPIGNKTTPQKTTKSQRMITKTAFLTSGILTLLSTASMAATIAAVGSFEINTFGVSGDRDRSLVGAVNGPPGYVVQRFVLPTLGAGEFFTSATFTVPVGVFFNGGSNGNDVDLFGLPATTATTPLASFATDPATLIQDTFIDDTVVVTTDPRTLYFVDTDTTGDSALLAYLNTQYAGGANAGLSIYLRFSPDPGTGGFDGYDIYNTTGTPEGGNFTAAQTGDALITYTVVPEPSVALTLASGLGLLGLVRRRRG